MRSRVSWLAGRPRISMVPESGPSTFMIMRRVVVLPAPLGPRRPKAAPRGTARERSSTATCPEKALFTPERRMASSLTPALSARASWGRRVYHRAFAGTSPRESEGRGRVRRRSAFVPFRRAGQAARGLGASPRAGGGGLRRRAAQPLAQVRDPGASHPAPAAAHPAPGLLGAAWARARLLRGALRPA